MRQLLPSKHPLLRPLRRKPFLNLSVYRLVIPFNCENAYNSLPLSASDASAPRIPAMKICPTCRKTYTDDGLNFCLQDGSVLTFAGPEQPATVVMNPPRPTDPSPGTMRPTVGQQPNWGNQPAYSMQPPKKSSRAWIWVVGILGLAVLLCGGGGIGLFLIEKMSDANNVSKGNSINRPNAVATPTPPPFSSTSVDTIDLSQWVKDFSIYGTTEFVGDELVMASKKKDFYYVLVAPDTYRTDGAATHVTVRNVENANSSLGYGLIFHSDTTPLIKDYAFLIDSKRQKYQWSGMSQVKKRPSLPGQTRR